MPKSLKALIKKLKIKVTIDDDFPDLSNDPVFVAKNKKAAKFIAEHGLPEDFKTKAKKSVKRKA